MSDIIFLATVEDSVLGAVIRVVFDEAVEDLSVSFIR
jgi:hypothetical protein